MSSYVDEEPDCESGAWAPRPINSVQATEKTPLVAGDDKKDVEAGKEGEKVDRKGLFMSLFILVISIPALIGAWCWPALVIGLVSGAVTAAARATGHYISFAITGAMMIGINIYMFYCLRTKRKKGTFLHRYGPIICTIAAAILIMADLTRHVLQDVKVWKEGPWPGSSQYRPNCGHENVTCLSAVGVVFTIIFTYSGFFLLFIGTMWNANIISKLKQIRRQWKLLREGKGNNPK